MSKPQPLIAIPAEIEAEMTPAVRAFVLDAFAQFEERICQLEAQLQKLTPRNSSIPPSSEHPHAKPKRNERPGKKRKRGGQKGHQRYTRELVPVERCQEVVVCHPTSCRRCGGELVLDPNQPTRHQVWDLPPIQPVITEYQLYRGRCECCGIDTTAERPVGVPRGQCGARLASFTGLLMAHFRQSKRRTSLFLSDLLNIPCSTGWTVKIQNLVSQAVQTPYQELRNALQEEPQLFVDESPTKEGNNKAWLWVAVARLFAVFGIFRSRKRESLESLVGDYQGIILNCDRAKMYLDGHRLQWCWAHIKRDIQRLIDSNDRKVRRMGHDLIRQQKQLFIRWRRYRSGKTKWETFQSSIRPFRKEFEALLLRGMFSGNDQLYGFCNELYSRRQHLWTFTQIEGIEPTNNSAERALRPAVIYRKLSFGTQSTHGSRYLERMLTVTETCRLQRRNVYEYLIDAVRASFAGRPSPTLLPSIPTAHAA